tara:strand:- start:545 stop:649 length:105 start_codon:yes stop_codon:yes gene_type:complete
MLDKKPKNPKKIKNQKTQNFFMVFFERNHYKEKI